MNTGDEKWLLEEKYHGEKTAGFFTDCARLKSGEPLAYVIGHIPFLNCKIYLDSRPLIPRTETEFWVDSLINQIQRTPAQDIHILDLCAGSGCIGVSIAKSLPKATIDFIEIDEQHISTIKKNYEVNGVSSNQVKVQKSDLFSSLKPEHQYNIIVTNPPYVDKELNRVDESVTKHEPSLALYGGHTGMDIITRIINEAPDFLSTGGELWIEHEPEQVELIKSLASDRFEVITYVDQYQIPRFSKLVLQ